MLMRLAISVKLWLGEYLDPYMVAFYEHKIKKNYLFSFEFVTLFLKIPLQVS